MLFDVMFKNPLANPGSEYIFSYKILTVSTFNLGTLFRLN